MMVPRSIPLLIKLGVEYLRFKRRVKKAAGIFKKELLTAGVDKDSAKRLTREYLRGARMMRQFDLSSMAKNAEGRDKMSWVEETP